MADPLSVSASIVGLITAGAKISQILAQVVRKAQHAPRELQNVQAEVTSIQAILGQLRNFLLGTQRASRSRTSLIMVDQVIASLATCVTTFSELDSFAKVLEFVSDWAVLDRLRWVAVESKIKEVLARLESHKTSLNLMLTILTCQKQEDAEDKVDRLCDLVQQILESNLVLAQRLDAFERTHTQAAEQAVAKGAALNIPQANEGLACDSDDDEDDPDSPTIPDSMWRHCSHESTFEKLLVNSRAYRKAPHFSSDAFSAISSARLTGSWSMLSGLSLSEISHIGILAIPIYESDLSNKEAYDFNTPALEITASDLGMQPSIESQRQLRAAGLEAGRESLFDPQFGVTDDDPKEKLPYTLGPALYHITAHANITVKFRKLRQDDETGGFVFGYVPAAMFEAGEFIKRECIHTKYIFSREGDQDHVKQLRKAADTPPGYSGNLAWDGYTVYDAASFFIQCLETLPEYRLPDGLYARSIPALASMNEEHREALVHKMILELPLLNKGVILYLVDFLTDVANKSEIRGIGTELAAIFAPFIFKLSKPISSKFFSKRRYYVLFPIDGEPTVKTKMASGRGNSRSLGTEIGLAI
ncbi:Rho GTPase activation protein [Xylaria sp. FL0043]|nr:Rho GTPase activation protein [Xylaria sp. FL0043]